MFEGFSNEWFYSERKDSGNISNIWSPQKKKKKNVTATIVLYKVTEATVISHDVHTNFIFLVVGILQGDALASYLVIISLHNVLQIFKRSNFKKWIQIF